MAGWIRCCTKIPGFLPNPYYSLINDTGLFISCPGTLGYNSRMQVENDTASADSHIIIFSKEEIHDFSRNYYGVKTDLVGGPIPLHAL